MHLCISLHPALATQEAAISAVALLVTGVSVDALVLAREETFRAYCGYKIKGKILTVTYIL